MVRNTKQLKLGGCAPTRSAALQVAWCHLWVNRNKKTVQLIYEVRSCLYMIVLSFDVFEMLVWAVCRYTRRERTCPAPVAGRCSTAARKQLCSSCGPTPPIRRSCTFSLKIWKRSVSIINPIRDSKRCYRCLLWTHLASELWLTSSKGSVASCPAFSSSTSSPPGCWKNINNNVIIYIYIIMTYLCTLRVYYYIDSDDNYIDPFRLLICITDYKLCYRDVTLIRHKTAHSLRIRLKLVQWF